MDDEHEHRGKMINPLVIGIFGIMAGAVMVAAYNFVSAVCCWACGRNSNNPNDHTTAADQRDQSDQRPAADSSSTTLDMIIMTGTSHSLTSTSTSTSTTRPANYNKKKLIINGAANISLYDGGGKGVDAGTCTICLTDFKVGDQVRVLPECFHVFHVSCVDTWLFSHPNCPLCRATAVSSTEDAGGAPPPELMQHPLPHIGG